MKAQWEVFPNPLISLTGLATLSILPAMVNGEQSRILEALFKALRPIARILLRSGIGYREFAEIAKTAFVDVSTADYGIRGRPTNISRVAAMTGLTRKEIKRVREKIEGGAPSEVYRRVPASDILHFWHSDPAYLDADGRPLELDFEGDVPSFASLVRKYGGDIPPGAMRTELKRVGAVDVGDTGRLKVTRRDFSYLGASDKVIAGFNGVSALASTVAHNSGLEDGAGQPFVQRSVVTRHVRSEDMKNLRRVATDRLSQFCESMDDLFGAYETLHSDGLEERRATIGVGVYYFEDKRP